MPNAHPFDDVQTLALQLVRSHCQLALQANPLQRVSAYLAELTGHTDLATCSAPQQQTLAVLAACLALDFVPADAQCIAQAWQKQSQRTGGFDPGAWPVEPADFGLPEASPQCSTRANHSPHTQLAAPAFAPCPHALGLYAVLPDAAWVGRMARAGVPTLQLRFKSDDPNAVLREVHTAVHAVQGTAAKLFINDHWQAAIQAGAYGVHLGQEDLQATSAPQLQAIRTAGLRLGLSTHGYAEMLRAAAVAPSYIAMGAVYATTLKRMATPPQGPQRLKKYTQLLRHFPTVAIGGIDASRLPEVCASGVGSVAVVRALVAADQPEQQAQALMDLIG
ncbi:thiamine phosphate synthase [Rhodoferax sp.]|uniref:thiamine phosphate synthase n=1 Tax=Rhodoferax sp. TaxID=50421 RepID=UPI00262FEDBD|nr:thiamine phosphate synthase [Rhodoferax sp.]MDD2811009.1 thiamine phosphate synthase [Rhodoferax sp.]